MMIFEGSYYEERFSSSPIVASLRILEEIRKVMMSASKFSTERPGLRALLLHSMMMDASMRHEVWIRRSVEVAYLPFFRLFQIMRETIIMAALSTLSPPHLSHISHSISALFRRHLRRLVALLSSPTLFTLTLRHLQSLSLHHKSLLIARHLLSNLTLLHHAMKNPVAAPPPAACMKLRDLDAVLLLLLLCELHQHDRGFLDAPPSRWRATLAAYASGAAVLRLSSFGGCSDGEALAQFVESVRRCWNLVGVMGCAGGGGEGKEAASAAAVVALPSVAVGGGEECVICREEMSEGRDVCELPCNHLFHWICILRWLKKRNTCPCCRRRLPTDDLRREIERLLEELAVIGGAGGGGLSQEWL